MYKEKKILGLIPARGGSKGIPHKNIKSLLGKPLLAYTAEAAFESGVIDKLLLSTDDLSIAEVGKSIGIGVPFMRPAELSQDTTPTLPVVKHALDWLLQNEDYRPDYVMLLQPTSPLRQSFHIKEAVDLIIEKKADSVLSVSLIPEQYSPVKAMVVNNEGLLSLYNGLPVAKRIARRQDLPITYWSTGAIYLFRTDLIHHPTEPNFYGEIVVPYVIDNTYTVDINTPEDWFEAEKALKKFLIKN